jgi:hypothetical protein
MERKQLYVMVPFEARFNWYLKRLNPQWFLRKVARMFEGQLKAAGGFEPAATERVPESVGAGDK